MLVVYKQINIRTFATIQMMFGGLCVHKPRTQYYEFKADGPDECLWLYHGGRRSDVGFIWGGGMWIMLAARVNGEVRKHTSRGRLNGGGFVIDCDESTLFLDDVIEHFPPGQIPPSPFQFG